MSKELFDFNHSFFRIAEPLKEEIKKSYRSGVGEYWDFKCNVFGNPVPQIILWQKDEVAIEITAEGKGKGRAAGLPEYEFLSLGSVQNATLVVSQVALSDRGKYTCVALNLYGNVTETTQLHVTGI